MSFDEEISLLRDPLQAVWSDEVNSSRVVTDFQGEKADDIAAIRLAVGGLLRFARANIFGPPTVGSEENSLVEEEARAALSSLEHAPSPLATELLALCLGRRVFCDAADRLRAVCPSVDWWALRTAELAQSVLPERCPRLQQLADDAARRFRSSPLFVGALPVELKVEFLLEATRSVLSSLNPTAAEALFQEAQQLCGARATLHGALGRRTRFQQRAIAQLRVDVETVGGGDAAVATSAAGALPPNRALGDDTLLDGVRFEEVGETGGAPLTSQHEALLLTAFEIERRTNPCDEIQFETLSAYLAKIVEAPQSWPIQTAALMARCRLEKSSTRRVERALGQAEDLDARFKAPQPNFGQRVDGQSFWLAARPPCWWHVEGLRAEILSSLGCVSEALAVFERLGDWDAVIGCYRALDKSHQAEAIVRQLIDERPDANLYCILGDITLNVDYYDKAWQISGGRSSRAQFSLGRQLMDRRRYAEAAEHLDRSLALQPLRFGAWFCRGYCAMQLEAYADAARAYHRCVGVEPDNFEAWNNLSAAYTHLGQTHKALRVLTEAIRHNYDNWKVWSNYLAVATDTASFYEAVRAFERLMQLKERFVDHDVLGVLVDAARAEQPASEVQQPLRARLREVCRRLTDGHCAADALVWRAYADLLDDATDAAGLAERVKLLSKAHYAAIGKQNWERDRSTCEAVLKTASVLLEEQARLSALNPDLSGSELVKMSVKPVLTKVRLYYGGDEAIAGQKSIADLFAGVDRLLIE